jgi:hypothetical protein
VPGLNDEAAPVLYQRMAHVPELRFSAFAQGWRRRGWDCRFDVAARLDPPEILEESNGGRSTIIT